MMEVKTCQMVSNCSAAMQVIIMIGMAALGLSRVLQVSAEKKTVMQSSV